MGEFVNERKSWGRGGFTTGEHMRVYASLNGTVTLAELIEKLHAWAPGVPDEGFDIALGTVRFQREATEEELEEKRRRQEASDAKRHEWQKREIRELIEKYGDDLSTWPSISQEELDQFRVDNPRYRKSV